MRMRNEDLGDARITDRAHESVDMGRVGGTWIEHGKRALADQERVRPTEGERPGVACGHTAHARRNHHRFTDRRREFPAELKRHTPGFLLLLCALSIGDEGRAEGRMT